MYVHGLPHEFSRPSLLLLLTRCVARRLPLSFACSVVSGKLPDNEVVMAHPSVSRSHALLVVDKTLGAFLIDLGASNGSFVDGRVNEADFVVSCRSR